MIGDDLAFLMWRDLSALAEDQWPAIRRAAATQTVVGLLADLDRPSPSESPLQRERQLRVGQFCLREVA